MDDGKMSDTSKPVGDDIQEKLEAGVGENFVKYKGLSDSEIKKMRQEKEKEKLRVEDDIAFLQEATSYFDRFPTLERPELISLSDSQITRAPNATVEQVSSSRLERNDLIRRRRQNEGLGPLIPPPQAPDPQDGN